MLFYFAPPRVPGHSRIWPLSVSLASLFHCQNNKILGVVFNSTLSFNSILPTFHRSKSCFTMAGLFDIFVQLLQTTSPSRSHAQWLTAASALPTSFFLARQQKKRFIESKALWQQRRRISITKTFKDLQWLPIMYLMDFKVAILTYKVLKSCKPAYLSSIINIDASRRALRSSADNRRLIVLQLKPKFASSIGKSRPIDIRNATSVQSFKTF